MYFPSFSMPVDTRYGLPMLVVSPVNHHSVEISGIYIPSARSKAVGDQSFTVRDMVFLAVLTSLAILPRCELDTSTAEGIILIHFISVGVKFGFDTATEEIFSLINCEILVYGIHEVCDCASWMAIPFQHIQLTSICGDLHKICVDTYRQTLLDILQFEPAYS